MAKLITPIIKEVMTYSNFTFNFRMLINALNKNDKNDGVKKLIM